MGLKQQRIKTNLLEQLGSELLNWPSYNLVEKDQNQKKSALSFLFQQKKLIKTYVEPQHNVTQGLLLRSINLLFNVVSR